MEKIAIDAAERTPKVILDPEKCAIEIVGRSLPENSLAFYEPIQEWLHEFTAHSTTKTLKVTLELEYYNTSSSKCLLDMLRRFGELKRRKWNIDVVWNYYAEDEDMLNSGVEFQSLLDYEFSIMQTTKKK